MNKNKIILFSITILFLLLLVITGSYARYTSMSGNKNILFNTSKNLENYIVYNEGESKFIGDLKVSSTYTEGIHSTISLYKTSAAANVDLIATIYMDINSIGDNIKNSSALKWTVTSGTSSNVISNIASGNFIGVNTGDTMTLATNIEVTTTESFYTIWIWLDASENPEDDLTGEILDTNVWTRIDQTEGIDNAFSITRINNNYQNISATAVNSKNKITAYAVTTSNEVPSTWTDIATNNQSNIYNLTHTVSQTGTYYIWFKDSDNKTVSRSITISSIDTTAPVCTYGSFNKTSISNNVTANITLTCIDSETSVTSGNLTTSDFTTLNNNIVISNVTKTNVAYGYQYTITVTGTSNIGNSSITLPANKIYNGSRIPNQSVTSPTIQVTYELGEIIISKTIQNYENTDPATFVYSVNATISDNNVYSDVAEITFTNPGTKTVTLSDVPVGSTVTVSEVYNARWYTLSTPSTVTVNLPSASPSQTASFTADYNYQGYGGGTGTKVNFNYDNTNGWSSYSIVDEFNETITYGTINITKTLSDFNTRENTEPATFSYVINALYNNSLVYSKSSSVTFNASGSQTITLTDVPLNTEVVIFEAYGSSLYNNNNTVQRTTFVSSNSPYTFTFTGSFDSTNLNNYGGYGTMSTYTYTSNNGWTKN